MAAIRHPAKTTKKKARTSKRAASPEDELAALRVLLDAAVNDYDETIRLSKLYIAAIDRNPPRLKPGEAWWEKVEERSKRIPPEELANCPPDGARNLDHYIYGTPKKEDEG